MTTNVIVHKEGEEGTIQVDRLTGRITTHTNDRPEWALGLANAMLQERLEFYEKRLGNGEAFKSLASADAIEFSDLAWIGVDANQDECELEANLDYRMDLVAKAIGVDRETGDITGTIIAEREIDRDNPVRSQQEREALEQAMNTGFATQAEQQQKQQSGTN